MAFVPFYERFPEIASKETREIIVLEKHPSGLPLGGYGFVDMYCDEPGCDCRRVYFSVLAPVTQKLLATICYGWESRSFYEKWGGSSLPKDMVDELKGPSLSTSSPQSKVASIFLDMAKNILLKDPNYIDRLKRHYQMFRKHVKEHGGSDNEYGEHDQGQEKQLEIPMPDLEKDLPISRNASCPCGSGKRYKNCCSKKSKVMKASV